MKLKDGDWNGPLDDGTSSDGLDAQAYQKFSDALKREPEYTLPVYFADRLLTLVESKEKAKENSRDNLWLGLGLLSLVIALVVAFVLTEFKASVGAFRFFSGYQGLIFFGIAFILALHWLDRKVIRKVEAF